MTIAHERPIVAKVDTVKIEKQRAVADVRWVAVQTGLWVGNVGGEFAGLIETRDGGAYCASDAFAHELGGFATLIAAKAAVRQSFDSRPRAAAPNTA